MMEITKNEFEVLYGIEFWNKGDPQGIANVTNISEKDAETLLKSLEEKGLIKIEIRDGKIYGAQLTSKGSEIYEDDKYLNWKLEWGY